MGLDAVKSEDEDFHPIQKKKRVLHSEKKLSKGNEDMENPAFIIDCGAHTAKLGFATAKTPKIIPNCIMKVKSERRRPFIGDQIEDCRDLSGLFYILPMQKGYIKNWDVQKPVWDYMFGRDCCNVRFQDTPFIITEPMLNFSSIQEATNEIFFEEYGIPSIFKGNPTDFAAYQFLNHPKSNFENNMDSCMVLDTGFSFTHIVPYINKMKYWPGVRRIDIGGKVLTNHLKEIISYRQLHVMDETHVINQAKEDACFISLNFDNDMQVAGLRPPENTIIREYVLPDYSTIKRGYVQTPTSEDNENALQQTLRLNNERFTVPEILFHPSDIGISQMGISEAIVNSINSCEKQYRAYMVRNIVVGGGNVKFPGFTTRLPKEIKKLCPTEWDCYVSSLLDPVTFAWKAAVKLSRDSNFKNMCVTRQEYEEHGNHYVEERFKYMVYNKPLHFEIPEDTSVLEDVPVESEEVETSYDIFEKKEESTINKAEEELYDSSKIQKFFVNKSIRQKQELLGDKELVVSLDKTDVETIMSKTAARENCTTVPISSAPKRNRWKKTLVSETEAQLPSTTSTAEISTVSSLKSNTEPPPKPKPILIRAPEGWLPTSSSARVVSFQTPIMKSTVLPLKTSTATSSDGQSASKTILLSNKTFLIPNLRTPTQISAGPRKGFIMTTTISNRTVTTSNINRPIILQNIRLQSPIHNFNEYFQGLPSSSTQQISTVLKAQSANERSVEKLTIQPQRSLLIKSQQSSPTSQKNTPEPEQVIIIDPSSDKNL